MSKLEIIVASTRPGRVGSGVARWIESEAATHGGFDGTEVADLAEVNLPFMKTTPVFEAVSVPFVQQFLDEDQRLLPNEVMTGSAKATLDELVRFTEASRPLRAPAAS
ncbi:hypothetical protein [Streptomyces sp. 16-176A]|uniref:hypothetical protein n=1 Tax=Streptomyces sp. 16-176A TaxID=2530458 RepID=UPI00345D9EE5